MIDDNHKLLRPLSFIESVQAFFRDIKMDIHYLRRALIK